MFNELEASLEPEADEIAADETITCTRKKTRRPSIDASLPREDVLHDIPDEDKVCDCCGHDLHRMGEETSEELEFIPATLKVLRHVRPKYSCRSCEKHGTETHIKIAPVPLSILPKSIASPSLLAQIISAKFQFGLPLYRQEALFKQFGIELNRQTMSRWLLKVSDKLRPLYRRMHDILLEQPMLWADETTVNVLDVDKSKCYMWVYGCGTARRKFIEAKHAARQELSLPIMNKLKDWLDKSALSVNNQSLLDKAIHYTLGQWSKLQVYLANGAVAIDNNRAERAIKPFVIGRKAWLFSKSRGGAQASAILYSVVEYAKGNGLRPVDYLMALFKQLPLISDGDVLDHLLPWNISLSVNTAATD